MRTWQYRIDTLCATVCQSVLLMTTAQPTPSPPLLNRTASARLTEQLAARFAERIAQRLLAPGARLPSVRRCAG